MLMVWSKGVLLCMFHVRGLSKKKEQTASDSEHMVTRVPLGKQELQEESKRQTSQEGGLLLWMAEDVSH